MEIIYRGDEYLKKPKRAEGEWTHNNLYRGNDLGTFNDTFEQAIQDGTFDNEYIGDTFTMGGHKYKIAGFNTKYGHEQNGDLGNHICLIGEFGSHVMNNSDTTQGGFAGTDMFKNYLPTIENQLKADWGSHLLSFNSYLSTGIDSSGVPNNGAWFNLTACLMNTVQVFGSPTQWSNNKNGMKYNIGDENDILPLYKLKPDKREWTDTWWWLRDIYNSQDFVGVYPGGSAGVSWDGASGPNGVRAFFLIN